MKLKLYLAAIMLVILAGLIPIAAMAEEKKDATPTAAPAAVSAAPAATATPAPDAATPGAPATPPDVKPVLN
ncbi:MAG: ammonium transporter, partial [Deltaproteobacteria bacterium]